MNGVHLYSSQRDAIRKLRSGCILCGGVGTGKSITSLAYFYENILGGAVLNDGSLSDPTRFANLYIITTARKRDTFEWESECERFGLSTKPMLSRPGIDVFVDSWNNIKKYVDVKDSFFIFDEQRVVGSGSWVKSFLKIAKQNKWILLSATPGDTWLDYIPVFVANGFYRNRSEFLREHAVFSRYTKYPKVDRFVQSGTLEYYRRKIMVTIEYEKRTKPHWFNVVAEYNVEKHRQVYILRWNPYTNEPIQDAATLCSLMRKVVNEDPSRLEAIKRILVTHDRLIIFYNHDYELEILRTLSNQIEVAEWNGHKHDELPVSDRWVYLVQYNAGAEGWNCTTTDTIVFYSQSYSYRMMTQAAGRIDRLNTPYEDLYYYVIKSRAPIDVMIARSLKNKKNFNERAFVRKLSFGDSYVRNENME